jgi:hypothetical protein
MKVFCTLKLIKLEMEKERQKNKETNREKENKTENDTQKETKIKFISPELKINQMFLS